MNQTSPSCDPNSLISVVLIPVPGCLDSLDFRQRMYQASFFTRTSVSFSRLLLNWVATYRHTRGRNPRRPSVTDTWRNDDGQTAMTSQWSLESVVLNLRDRDPQGGRQIIAGGHQMVVEDQNKIVYSNLGSIYLFTFHPEYYLVEPIRTLTSMQITFIPAVPSKSTGPGADWTTPLCSDCTHKQCITYLHYLLET